MVIRYSYRSYKFGRKQISQFLLPNTSTRSKHFETIAGDPASNSTGNPRLSSTIIVNNADVVVSSRSWLRIEVGPLLNDNQIQIDGCTFNFMVGHALEPAQSTSDTTDEQAEDETSGDKSIPPRHHYELWASHNSRWSGERKYYIYTSREDSLSRVVKDQYTSTIIMKQDMCLPQRFADFPTIKSVGRPPSEAFGWRLK